MKTVFVFLSFVLFVSCMSAPQPVIIRKLPENTMHEDMSVEEYIAESTRYAVELNAYTEELINQIIHKANHIDLRNE